MSGDNTQYTYSRGVKLIPDDTIEFNLTLAMENLSHKYPNFIQDSNVDFCTVYYYIKSPDLAEGWHYDFDGTKKYKELITQDYDGNLWRRSAMFGYRSHHDDKPVQTTGLRFYIKHGEYNIDKNKFLEKHLEEQISELIDNGFKELEVYWQSVGIDGGEYVLLDTSVGETREAFVSDTFFPLEKIDLSLNDTRDSDNVGDVGINDDSNDVENSQGDDEYIFVGSAFDIQDKKESEENLNNKKDVEQQKDKKIANEQSQTTTNENEETKTKIEDSKKKIEMSPFLFWVKKYCWKWIFNLVRRIYEYFTNSQTDIDDSLKTEIKNSSTVNDISRNNNQEKSPKLDQGVPEENKY